MTSSALWVRVNKEPISEQQVRVTSLTESNEYEVRVAAQNKAGIGEFSAPSAPFTAQDPWKKPGKPGKPTCSDVTGSSLQLTWSAPADDGGAQISNYVIEYRQVDSLSWETYEVTSQPQPEVTRKIEQLVDDTEYVFREAAENRAGRGPFSDPSDPTHTAVVGSQPVLGSPLKDVTVTAPETATFECDLDLGQPEATVQWFKGGKELYPGDKKYDAASSSGVTSLHIYVDDVSDDDVYKVVAKNKLGEISSEAQLTVYSK